MSLVNQFGAAMFGDLLPVNILAVTEDKYLPAIQAYVARENEFLSQITEVLCDTGTDPQTGFYNGITGSFQKLSTEGDVEATRGGQRWYTQYPIYAWGTKQVYTYTWLKRATFIELTAAILEATLADVHTTIVQMLTALLNNVNYTFDETKWPGMKAEYPGSNVVQLTVTPLANADGSIGSVYARGKEVQLANTNAYLTYSTLSAAAFAQNRAFLSNVANDADIVHVVSKATADSIQGTFTAGTDFIAPVELLQTTISQDLFGKYAAASQYGLYDPGIRTRGRIGGLGNGELVEWPHFPDNYIFSYDRKKERPLRRRVSDLPDEQGLVLAMPDDTTMPDIQKNPLVGRSWRRLQGFGGRNRMNGVVTQITGGSYTVPTIV